MLIENNIMGTCGRNRVMKGGSGILKVFRLAVTPPLSHIIIMTKS